jgi:nucleoside-triphosphatase THEP1
MTDHVQSCKIALVIGPKNSGKTSYLKIVISRAQHKGLTVGGILSVSRANDLEKKDYFLYDIQTNREELLASADTHSGYTIQYGEYQFNPKIFESGNQILQQSTHSDLIILDEFGPLELQRSGFYQGFNFLLNHYKGILIIALRPALQQALRKIISGS